MLKPLFTRRRTRLLVLLFTLLTSIYLLSYSASIESGDARRLLDAVSSFADYGDFYLDLAAIDFLPSTFSDQQLPLQTADVEPLQIVFATPLYVLAKLVPGFGLVHTVYLFNILICALAACVLFLYALALDYDEKTALLAAVMFGVGTAVFPYSKSFFREPLMLLMLLLAALMIERLRVHGYRSRLLLVLAIIAVAGLLLTKASALLAFPALLVIALPSRKFVITRRAVVAAGGILLLGLVLFAVLSISSVFGTRYNLVNLFNPNSSSYLIPALQAYLLSIGGSIWGTSPVVLLALPGIWFLLRARQWRYPTAIILLLASFAFGYAALNGQHWFGGLSWSPRFLIPVLPFLMLGALPVIQRMFRYPFWALLGITLLVYGVWVQLSGVAIPLSDYPRALPPESGGLLEWSPALNDPRYLRWAIVPQIWSGIPLDSAWMIGGVPGMLVVFAAIAVASVIFIMHTLRRPVERLFPALVLLALLLVALAVGLRLLYANDPRYRSNDETLYAMLPILEAETDPGDVILLSSPLYESFFANAGKLNGAGRVIALPLQPGEQPSPEQQPEIRSDNPIVLLNTPTLRLLYSLAAQHDRLWLLVNAGPDLPWSVRPVERFLSSHFYPTGEVIQTGPLTRLIEYSTINAPDQFAFRSPEHLTDLTFDDRIHLIGFDLPAGDTFAPGDVLPISTQWVTRTPLEANYSFGLYLRDASGAEVAQVDSQPGAGFFPTSEWQPNVPVWDNRAFRLPASLAPGQYQLWVKLYDFSPDGTVRDLQVTSGDVIDGSIGILPLMIHLTEHQVQSVAK